MRSTGSQERLWYPLRRRGVRVVDGAALEKRCAKAPRVRIPPSPPHSIIRTGRSPRPVLMRSGRGRLVDYGAALEMRFGATRRGFESRPLRHRVWHLDARGLVDASGPSLTHLGVCSLRSSASPCHERPSAIRHRVAREQPSPALAPVVLTHAPSGALVPVLGRRLGLDCPLAPLGSSPHD